MTQSKVLIIAVAIFFCLVVIQILVKNKHPIRKTFFGIVTGILSLIAVNMTGTFTGVVLPISVLSVSIASIMGIPGITMMLLLDIMM